MRNRLTVAAILAGVMVPLLYYGIQIAAAPYFPGFSFAGTTASELGSDRSPRASIFNVGIMLQGVASLLASVGFLLAFRRLGVHRIVAWLTSLALAMNGVQTLWAGYYPMPDPRHGGHPVFIVGMILLPILLAASLWRVTGSWLLRAYWIATLALLAAMFPIMSGMTGLDTHDYRGLQQRVFTLAIFPPIGMAACVLARRINGLSG